MKDFGESNKCMFELTGSKPQPGANEFHASLAHAPKLAMPRVSRSNMHVTDTGLPILPGMRPHKRTVATTVTKQAPKTNNDAPRVGSDYDDLFLDDTASQQHAPDAAPAHKPAVLAPDTPAVVPGVSVAQAAGLILLVIVIFLIYTTARLQGRVDVLERQVTTQR